MVDTCKITITIEKRLRTICGHLDTILNENCSFQFFTFLHYVTLSWRLLCPNRCEHRVSHCSFHRPTTWPDDVSIDQEPISYVLKWVWLLNCIICYNIDHISILEGGWNYASYIFSIIVGFNWWWLLWIFRYNVVFFACFSSTRVLINSPSSGVTRSIILILNRLEIIYI